MSLTFGLISKNNHKQYTMSSYESRLYAIYCILYYGIAVISAKNCREWHQKT